ncbi:MAG: hypothetical protein KZQ95_07145 [Candidatus Thiodiazotropha sp. (ex Epidulcina cf. delphinae)]|nr:hypothetical protein [Candidatus Thiodiazotropha sp. (ex Epidulcina cf. delphinae)]
MAGLEQRLRIRYAGHWPMTRLLREIRALPDQSLVLLGVYFRDADDRFFPARKSARLKKRSSIWPFTIRSQDCQTGYCSKSG